MTGSPSADLAPRDLGVRAVGETGVHAHGVPRAAAARPTRSSRSPPPVLGLPLPSPFPRRHPKPRPRGAAVPISVTPLAAGARARSERPLEAGSSVPVAAVVLARQAAGLERHHLDGGRKQSGVRDGQHVVLLGVNDHVVFAVMPGRSFRSSLFTSMTARRTCRRSAGVVAELRIWLILPLKLLPGTRQR